MDVSNIESGAESSVSGTQRGKGGKPSRKLDFIPVYDDPLELQFKWDSIVAMLKDRFGSSLAQWQLKVFLTVDRLCRQYGEISVSCNQVDKSGCFRGMSHREVDRSLVILFELGLVEVFGEMTIGGHKRYRLSSLGDKVVAWIAEEYARPKDTLRYKSKIFRQVA